MRCRGSFRGALPEAFGSVRAPSCCHPSPSAVALRAGAGPDDKGCGCHGSIMRSWMSGPPVGRSRPGCSSRPGSTFSEFAGPAAVVGSRVATRAGSSGRITSSSQLPTVPQSTVMARASGAARLRADHGGGRLHSSLAEDDPASGPVCVMPSVLQPYVGRDRKRLRRRTLTSQPRAGGGKGGGVTPPLSLARQVATGCAPAPDLDAASHLNTAQRCRPRSKPDGRAGGRIECQLTSEPARDATSAPRVSEPIRAKHPMSGGFGP